MNTGFRPGTPKYDQLSPVPESPSLSSTCASPSLSSTSPYSCPLSPSISHTPTTDDYGASLRVIMADVVRSNKLYSVNIELKNPIRYSQVVVCYPPVAKVSKSTAYLELDILPPTKDVRFSIRTADAVRQRFLIYPEIYFAKPNSIFVIKVKFLQRPREMFEKFPVNSKTKFSVRLHYFDEQPNETGTWKVLTGIAEYQYQNGHIQNVAKRKREHNNAASTRTDKQDENKTRKRRKAVKEEYPQSYSSDGLIAPSETLQSTILPGQIPAPNSLNTQYVGSQDMNVTEQQVTNRYAVNDEFVYDDYDDLSDPAYLTYPIWGDTSATYY